MRLFDLFEASTTDTPEFRRWFAGSKAVDRAGNPLKLYHGTNADFDQFSTDKIGSRWHADTWGFFFTPSSHEASDYSSNYGPKDGGTNVIPVYLSIKKPLNWAALLWYYGGDGSNTEAEIADYARRELSGRGMVDYFETSHKQAEWMEFIKDGGFDGIILQDPDNRNNGIYIALNPNQIKSVFNRGEWKQDDPRLSESATDSPAFRNWFKNSKIVDRSGQPLAVHHGTAIPKTAFRASRADNMHGIYFTPDLTAAHDHANMDAEVDGDDPLVYSVFLSIQNPLIVRSGVVDDPRVKLNNLGQPTQGVGQMDYQQLTTEMLNLLIQDGYDGIVITNGPVEDASEIVAFYPNQIKSVSNQGNWNSDSHHMNEDFDRGASDKAFQRWFSGSKIVDHTGKPLKVFHGTNREFDRFIRTGPFGAARARTAGGQMLGKLPLAFFTADPDVASEFAGEKPNATFPPKVLPVYLSIKKPWVLDAKGEPWNHTHDQLIAAYQSGEYDGAIIRNSADSMRHPMTIHDVYVSFSPSQIKSVFNKGTWNSKAHGISEASDANKQGIPDSIKPTLGIKVGKNARFFRGESESSGSNGATYGAGLYTTTNRSYAAKFGKVRELSRWEALPDNPLRFRTIQDWELWLQRYDQYHGILGARDRGQKHNDIGDYIRIVFPDVDGVQIGLGNDMLFVAWPTNESITEGDRDEVHQFLKNSVIKNPDGSPKMMFHWGPKGITKFRGMPTSSFLIYWNADSFSARVAARNEEHEYRAYIRCEKPYGTPQQPLHWGEAEEKADRIKKAGYDGIWVKDEGDVSLAVYDSDQIWLINPVQEAILNELRIVKDNGAGNDKQIVVAFRGWVWLLPWYANTADESVLTDMAYRLGLDLDDWDGDVGYMMDSFDEIIENRPDIIYGVIRNNDLHLMNRPGASAISPMTSPMIAKMVKQLDLDGASYGYFNMDGDDNTNTVGADELRGALPERLYHGTSSDYMHSIARTGIRPGVRSNWSSAGIQHKQIIFGAVAVDGAVYHANRTAGTDNPGEYGADDVGESFPVILEFTVPDPNQVVPDYDVAASLIGDEHPVSDRLGYTNQGGGNFGRSLNTMVADQNPEGRAWKSTGIFGYTGRIPPKYITRVFTSWEPGQSMDDPEWSGSLQEFFREWTARYEGDPEEQEDENY